MIPEDVFAHQLQGTIEGLRYWVPSIVDVADVAEDSGAGYWHLRVAPKLGGGCPFEIVLRQSRLYDALLARESYEDLPIDELALFLQFAESIVEGRVVQRRWVSSQTGALRGIETLVAMPDGKIWHHGAAVADGCECHDRHFLPYRR